MSKYIENLALKTHEDKYENTEDSKQARSLSDPFVYNALHAPCSRKVFEPLSYGRTHDFFGKIYKHIKGLFELSKQVSKKQILSLELLKRINLLIDDKSCSLTKMIYERTFFPENGGYMN